MTLLQIAVAAPIDQVLTYNLPDSVQNSANVSSIEELTGRRVLVPLGRRKVTGYVLGEAKEEQREFTIKNIVEVLDSVPLFHANLIGFFHWIAKYYHYPVGEVIKAALPGGLSAKSTKYIELTEKGKLERVSIAAESALSGYDWVALLLQKGKISPTKSRELQSKKQTRKILDELIGQGMIIWQESIVGNSLGDKLETCYSIDFSSECTQNEEGKVDYKLYSQKLESLLNEPIKLSEGKTIYYLEQVREQSGKDIVPKKELTALYSGASKALGKLKERGIVHEHRRRVYRNPLGEQLEFFPAPDSLTPEQEAVMAEVIPAINEKCYTPFLLHGVTGSGKTEVYLQAAAETLKCGRSVLVIVPEIALATQLEAHFVSRFGDKVVLLHSGLTPQEKYDQWSLAFSGKGQVVIGARSAIFAPLVDPGLIVVDEEHDSGLKQDDSLRYNGRDLAVVRGRMQNCVVLLSSATPSVVSYNNAQKGKYRLLTMANRVGSRPLPKVNLIDLRQKVGGKNKSLFRPVLQTAMRENLERGKQSVILINRRGFSANVICQECGTPVQCRHCHVSLTLHKSKQQLLCHYCGYSVHDKTVCENCNSHKLVPVGFGTERVEEELQALFPEARIARLDADTAKDRKMFLHTLKRMRAGDVDIIIGTQMVAKGHHFPGVTLVGVVWADGGLNIPDYRSAEKTFQLVTQVTGRAGRGEDPGEVYIQTMRPEHYAIAYARAHRYEDLVEKELTLRSNPRFPPFVRIAVIHIRGESEEAVQRNSMKIAGACRAVIKERKSDVEILGPAPSPIDRLKNQYRWQVMIKSESYGLLHSICEYVRTNKTEFGSGGCRVILDIDPENMM